MQDLFFAIFPLALLIWLLTKPKSMSPVTALPLMAGLMYLVQLIYFRADPLHVHAAAIDGILTALTPISIVGGAILLFKVMEHSGSVLVLNQWFDRMTGNKVGQLMVLGWSFSFLIEGISGFGTPIVLTAPILVSLGFSPFKTAVFCLVLNTSPVSFGAVGMPAWFGFAPLNLTGPEMIETGFKTAVLHTAASLVVPVLALGLMVPWREVRKNLVFIFLSILASMVPYLALSRYSVEFPSVIGGFVGLAVTVWLAHSHIGLVRDSDEPEPSHTRVPAVKLIKALFPIWGTVLLLVITRFPLFGLKDWLTSTTPQAVWPLGTLGDLKLSPSLVVGIDRILGTATSWSHALLYVPSILPFVLVSVIALFLFRLPKEKVRTVGRESWRQLRNPAIALVWALVFVELFMLGGDRSPSTIIGRQLASWAGGAWQFGAVYLGMLGAFFSGSNTVSNLTFGPIQDAAAKTLGLDRTLILGLQSVGGAAGHMVCIHSVVAACAVLSLHGEEGHVIRKAFGLMVLYGVVAGVTSVFL